MNSTATCSSSASWCFSCMPALLVSFDLPCSVFPLFCIPTLDSFSSSVADEGLLAERGGLAKTPSLLVATSLVFGPTSVSASFSSSFPFALVVFFFFFLLLFVSGFLMPSFGFSRPAPSIPSESTSASSSRFRFFARSSKTSFALLADSGSSFARRACRASSLVCFFFFH